MDKQLPGDGSNLTDDKTAYNCAICSRPDHDEDHMVFCEGCKVWLHFSCAGVGSEVEYDENWRCSSCREFDPTKSSDEESDAEGAISVDDTIDGARKSSAPNPQTVSEDEEVAAAIKRMKMEKERMKRRMEQKLALAKAQMELENEKLEMEWALEKQIMEMKIASKAAFQKKREMEKKKLQNQLQELCNGEVRMESEIRKLEKQKEEAKRSVADKKGTRTKPEEIPTRPVSSTPIVHPEASTSTAGAKKKIVDRQDLVVPVEKKKFCGNAKKEENVSTSGSRPIV